MNLLPKTAESVQPSMATRIWHRAQERIRQPSHRETIARMLARVQPAGIRCTDAQRLADLRDEGVAMYRGFCSPGEVLELRTRLEGLDCFDPWNAASGTFASNAIPAGTHVAQIPDAPRLPELIAMATQERLVGLATAYLGCRPTLDSIQAWWSESGNDAPQEAENFHRDNDAIRFLKFFLYLTDVGPNNGPHVFVAGSHRLPSLLQRRRLSDEEVEQAFGRERLRVMTGSAGDAFMEDTWGIHKGQLPQQGRRLLVQFRYSISETIFRSPVTVESAGLGHPRHCRSLIHAG